VAIARSLWRRVVQLGNEARPFAGQFRAPLGVAGAGRALLPSRSRAYEMGCDL